MAAKCKGKYNGNVWGIAVGGGAPRFDGTKLREIKCACVCTYAMPLHRSKSEDP